MSDDINYKINVVVAGVLGRHDEVDAVRPVADLVFDPLQVDLELFG